MRNRRCFTLTALGFLVCSVLATGGVAGVGTPVSKVPGAPTSLWAGPMATAIRVSWSPPTSPGGAPLVGYLVTTTPGSASCSTTGVTHCLVDGLTNGLAYTVHVQAVNQEGRGPAVSRAGVKPTTAQNCSYKGPYANLQNCDLTGAILFRADLLDADLAHTDLTDTGLHEADLTGTTLTGSDLAGANLDGASSGLITGAPGELATDWSLVDGYLIGPEADLNGADLGGANLSGDDLSSVNLTAADLAGADLSTTDLGGAVLTGALSGGVSGTPIALPDDWSLVDGYLVGPGADLVDANLARADLDGADLSAADLNGVSSGGINGTPAALPSGWSLIDSYLIGPGANLVDAELRFANLSGADLSGADLSNADLNDADLSGADLAAVVWSDTICPDGTDSDNDGGTCADNPASAERLAQADLNTALTNAKAYSEQNDQSYGSSAAAIVAAMDVQEPFLTWTVDPSVSSGEISVTASADGEAILLAAQGDAGTCWYIVDNLTSEASSTSPPWSLPGAVFVPVGTWDGEIKNVSTPPTCAASAVAAGPNSATQAFETTGFPDL